MSISTHSAPPEGPAPKAPVPGDVVAPPGPANADALPSIEGYEVLAKIAAGGMATVYRGRDTRTGATVAIKMLSSEFTDNPVLRRRFEQEFRTAHRLHHPNLVRSLDFGHSPSGPYLILEFVEGESLGARIDRRGALPPAEAIGLVAQVARALDYAHQAGVIHRDVKPDNIMLTPDGQARLTDFGLVKQLTDDLDLTRPGKGLGTPNFIAPEQLRNAKGSDRRCDIYGLGATLYMAVTGHYPFEARTQIQVLRKKANNELVLPRQIMPGLSEDLERVILRAMHPDCGQRPASCTEFLDELAGPPPASPAAVPPAADPAGTPPERDEAPAPETAEAGVAPAPAARRAGGPGDWIWFVVGALALGVSIGAVLAFCR
jgi:serine/threonine protein kinase